MEPTNVNGVPVVILAQPVTTNAAMQPYSSQRQELLKKMSILGTLQIVFGSLCVIFQSIAIELSKRYWLNGITLIGYGIWTGVIFIVTGSFGCAAGRLNNKSLMMTFNVLTIISASINVFLFSFSVMSADIQAYYGASRYYYHDDSYRDEFIKWHRASIALESLMSILALAETVVAIWSSVVCCKIGACCCDCGDSCCCPPAPVPTQIHLTQQNIDGQLQQTVVMYTANAPQQPVANTSQDSKNQPEFPYQQLVAAPNLNSDFEAADHTRLCV